jgi:NhaP-type Na+/H+ or K+/H+ antiporter
LYFVLAGVQLSEIKPSIIDSRDTLEIVNAVLFYLAFAYIVITPISTYFFLVAAKPEGLKNEVIMTHFGSLYKGLDIDSRLKLFQVTVF